MHALGIDGIELELQRNALLLDEHFVAHGFELRGFVLPAHRSQGEAVVRAGRQRHGWYSENCICATPSVTSSAQRPPTGSVSLSGQWPKGSPCTKGTATLDRTL